MIAVLILPPTDYGQGTLEEALDPTRDASYVYFTAKILAERAQWQFVKEHPQLDVVSSKSDVLRALRNNSENVYSPP